MPFYRIRPDISLEDRTAWELISLLEGDGWVWHQWTPPSRRRPHSPPLPSGFAPGSPKIWYSSGVRACTHYLVCLLRADSLFESGLQMIPHAAPLDRYRRILHGDFGDYSGHLRVSGHLRPALGTEGADMEMDTAIEAEEDSGHALDPDAADSDILEALAAALAEDNPDDPDDDATPTGLPADEPAAGDTGAVAEQPALLPPEPAAFVDSTAAAAAPASALEAVSFGIGGAAWGVFSLSRKAASPGRSQYGGFFATCPFHRRSFITACKKWSPILGPTEADKEAALCRLLWWCARAPEYGLQATHVHGVDIRTEPCPPWSVIRLRCITERPPPAMTDAEACQLVPEDPATHETVSLEAALMNPAATSSPSAGGSSSPSGASSSGGSDASSETSD